MVSPGITKLRWSKKINGKQPLLHHGEPFAIK